MLKLKTACAILIFASLAAMTCNSSENSELPPPQPSVNGSAGTGGWGGAPEENLIEGGSGGEGGTILIDGKVPSCLDGDG